MNNFFSVSKNFFLEKVVNQYPKTFSFVRNLFAVLGIFTSVYLIFFLSFQRPQMIEESENKIKMLNKEIKENNKEISRLEKENKKIVDQVGKLNDQLTDLQIKNKKYVKDYEKNVGRISTMSNNQLSRAFADAFDE